MTKTDISVKRVLVNKSIAEQLLSHTPRPACVAIPCEAADSAAVRSVPCAFIENFLGAAQARKAEASQPQIINLGDALERSCAR